MKNTGYHSRIGARWSASPKCLYSKNSRLVVLFSVLTMVSITAPAQTTKTVVATNRSYSPSITSIWKTTTTHDLVAAYTYSWASGGGGNDRRSVGISKSTDNGSTWTNKPITKPFWYGTSSNPSTTDTLSNVDDPQVYYAKGGGAIVCVVRAWSTDNTAHTTMAGQTVSGGGYLEQPYSIFVKCGIYICISKDNGDTWG